MGYTTNFYAVDLGAVRAAIGSKDAALTEGLLAEFKDELARSDKWFAKKVAAGAPSLATAIAELVDGKPLNETAGFQYGYALELLCRHFGEQLDIDDISFISDLELDTRLNEDHRLPITMPKPDDFPSINFLVQDDLKREIANVKPQVKADDDEADEDMKEARESFLDALKQAQESGKDLVIFTY